MARNSLVRLAAMVAVGLVLSLISPCPALHAQSQAYTATLSGTVSDPTGAFLSGAKVTLTSPERGITREYTTESSGSYIFSQVPPGVYSLQVTTQGFKTYKQEGITLAAGQTAQQPIVLAIGTASESIVVTSEVPLVNTDNANISSDISAQQVEQLPLNLRNVYGLAFLNSSVSNTAEFQIVGGNGISGSADQDISFFNFGGTFFNTAAYLLDGTWDTGADWGGVTYVPAVDDVQEFKIQTNAFTAQYGWSSGNVINVVTKSGTNGYHGDAYEFYRNSALDARNFFNNDKQPDFHRHQFGVTFGGPIRKDKTYFFVYYEGLRQQTPVTFGGTMPTDDFRNGNFSALLGSQIGTDALGRPILAGQIYDPFSTRTVTAGQVDPVTGLTASKSGYIRDPFQGNIISNSRWDAISKNILNGNFWPAATSSALANNFSQSAAAEAHSDEYSIRVDHNLSDKSRLFARWSQKFESKVNVPEYYGSDDPAGPGATNPNNRYSFDLDYNHVFSPTFLISANIGVNRWVEGSLVQSFGYQASQLGLPSFIDGISPVFPQVQPQGFSGLGPNVSQDDYIVPRTLWTAAVDLNKIVGKHNLSFGWMGVLNQIYGGHYFNTTLTFPTSFTGGPDPQNESAGTGSGFASFLLGVGNGQTGYNTFPATQKYQLGWYLQDNWRTTQKLTLNLGLRYEIQTAPTERHNVQEYFDFNAVNPISQDVGFNVPGALVFNDDNNRGLYQTSYKNFAPRIGLTYQVLPKLVFRSGYGVFFTPNYYGNGPTTGYSQATPWVGTLDNQLTVNNTLSDAFPNGQILPQGSAQGGLTDVGFGLNPVVNPIRHSPYVQQWMAGFQYSLTANDMLDITYVGNHGVHVLAQYLEWNQLPTEDLALGDSLNDQVPNPFFGHIAASGCGLDQPTVIRGQLLRPFPEYCSVTEAPPAVGGSSYNALQATYTRRWHSGLNLNVSYTYSKFLDNVQGSSGWAFPGSGSQVRDAYNLAAERSVDTSDIPHSLVVNYIYELPFGHGKQFGGNWTKPVNAVLGGWQFTGIFYAKSGFPLSITAAQNNTDSFGGNQRPNLIGDPVPQNQNIHNWINADAFAQPAAFTFGDAPRTFANLRAPRYVDWDMGIQKWWNFTEAKKLEFRLEMFNALNHPNFFAPDTNLGDVSNGSFGTISQAYPSRDVQLAAKFYW
ncbi:MAG TPA: TonB-dependent receptor [Terriglobales bacterium]|nr:TonB-dependent receptor [Terriglobales bacterium]